MLTFWASLKVRATEFHKERSSPGDTITPTGFGKPEAGWGCLDEIEKGRQYSLYVVLEPELHSQNPHVLLFKARHGGTHL